MDKFTLGFWAVGIVLLMISFLKDRSESIKAMKKSRKMMKTIIGDIIGIILLIGLILELIPETAIRDLLGSDNALVSTTLAAIAGSVTLIPGFVAFPLVGSFIDHGASILPAVAFLTTLTMVGVVTFPLEKKEFGLKFALTRNLLSFIAAILISFAMGVII